MYNYVEELFIREHCQLLMDTVFHGEREEAIASREGL